MPEAQRINQISRPTLPGSEGLQGGPAVPDHSSLRPRAHGVDQLFQAAGVRVRRPSVSTSSPG